MTTTANQPRLREGEKLNSRNMVRSRAAGGRIDEVRIDAIEHHIDNHRHIALHNPAKLDALAASMAERGLLQPVLVAEVKTIGKREAYCLVYGYRRLAAAKQLGWETIRAEIAPAMTDADILLERAIENLHREDLNPMEQVTAVRQACDSSGGDSKLAARRLGVTEAFVRDRLHLASGLGDRARDAALAGLLKLGHLRELVKVRDLATQDRLVEHLTTDWRGDEPRIPTVEEVRQDVVRELTDLALAPWTLDAPFAGKRACAGCPGNTSSQPDLFGDELTGHCTDRECFAAKNRTARQLADDAAHRLVKLKVDKVGKDEVERAVDEIRTETDAYDGGIDIARLAPQVRSMVQARRPTRQPGRNKLTPLQKAIKKYQDALRTYCGNARQAIAKKAAAEANAMIALRCCVATKAWADQPTHTDAGDVAEYGGKPRAPRPPKTMSKTLTETIDLVRQAMQQYADGPDRYQALCRLAALPMHSLDGYRGGRLMDGSAVSLAALAAAMNIDLPDPPSWETFQAAAEAKRPAKTKSKRAAKKAPVGNTPKARAASKKRPSRKKVAPKKGGAA